MQINDNLYWLVRILTEQLDDFDQICYSVKRIKWNLSISNWLCLLLTNIAYGHITLNTLVLICSPKLRCIEPGQYVDRRPLRNNNCYNLKSGMWNSLIWEGSQSKRRKTLISNFCCLILKIWGRLTALEVMKSICLEEENLQ